MPQITPYSIEKQAGAEWCWLASTASVYNHYIKTGAWSRPHSLLAPNQLWHIMQGDSSYAAKKSDNRGGDFAGSPRRALEALDCLGGYQALQWLHRMSEVRRHVPHQTPMPQQPRMAAVHQLTSGRPGPASRAFAQQVMDSHQNRMQAQQSTSAQRTMLLNQMKAEINSRRPVICGYRLSTGGMGHAVVMVGYDGDELICKDPMKGETEDVRLPALETMPVRRGEARLDHVCLTKAPDEEVVDLIDNQIAQIGKGKVYMQKHK